MKQALGELATGPRVAEGRRVGIQATFANAAISGELIRANSVMPPDWDKGPTGSTLHKISSEQNPVFGSPGNWDGGQQPFGVTGVGVSGVDERDDDPPGDLWRVEQLPGRLW